MSDVSKEDILHILELTHKIENGKLKPDLSGKIGVVPFLEPSTRTFGSFEYAIKRLNGQTIDFPGTENNSIKKGESAYDSIKTMGIYGDFIVLRVPEEGLARLASEIVNVPVINGGDGSNQHPTQALLDMYAIKKTQNTLENLTIGFVGDLKYSRTVHSLIKSMSFFNPKFKLISPPSLKIPESFIRDLQEQGIEFEELIKIEDAIEVLDVCYMTRIQEERFPPDGDEYNKVRGFYVLEQKMLKNVKPNLKILHPMPRRGEIPREIDETPYAYYWQQAEGGITVRKAILYHLLLEGKS